MSATHMTAPGIGLHLDNNTATVWNRTGSTLQIGNVVQFDMTEAQSETAAAGGWRANVIVPTAASATIPGIGSHVDKDTVSQPPAIFGVVVNLLNDKGVDNTRVLVAVRGNTIAVLPPSGSTLTKGMGVFPAATVMTATNVLTKGVKCIGFANATSTGNDALTLCTIDGINGFGVAYQDDVD